MRPSHLPDLVNETDHLDPSHSRGPRRRLRKSASPSAQLPSRKEQHHRDDIRDSDFINGENKSQVHHSRHRHKATLDEAPLEVHSRVGDSGQGLLDAASDIHPPDSHAGMSQRNSRKRPAGEEPVETYDNDTELATSDRSRKRTRLLHDESAFAAGSAASLNTSRSDQSQEVRTSSRTRAADTENVSREPLASSKLTVASAGVRHASDTHNAEASSSSKYSVHDAENGGSAQAPCSLTIPMAPTFSSDVLRQRRLLAKSEREKHQREKGTKKKTRSLKSDGSSSTAPSSSKQVSFYLRSKGKRKFATMRFTC